MVKRLIAFFLLVFFWISIYSLYPSYKRYIKAVLLWPTPLIKQTDISKELQFNSSTIIKRPINLINTLYNLNEKKLKNFIELKSHSISYINDIRFIIGDPLKARVQSLSYNGNKNIIKKSIYKNLSYWEIIQIKYETAKGYKNEGDMSINLRRLLNWYYKHIYIKTNRNFIIDITFNTKKARKNWLSNISGLYDYISKKIN